MWLSWSADRRKYLMEEKPTPCPNGRRLNPCPKCAPGREADRPVECRARATARAACSGPLTPAPRRGRGKRGASSKSPVSHARNRRPRSHTCIQRKPILAPSLNEYLDRPSSSSSSSPPSPQRKHAARSPYAGHYSEPLACSSGSPEPPQLHLHKRRRGTEMSTSLPKAAPPAVASEPRSPSSRPQHYARSNELGR